MNVERARERLGAQEAKGFSDLTDQDVDRLGQNVLHEDARVYLRGCLPRSPFDTKGLLFLSSSRLKREIEEFAPGVYIAPFGFVPIATTATGDAICLDGRYGGVVFAAHNWFDEDEICYINFQTGQLDGFDEYTEDNVRFATVMLASNPNEFLDLLMDGKLASQLAMLSGSTKEEFDAPSP